MLWWEARIKLSPEDYEFFAAELERIWAAVCRGEPANGHGSEWDAEAHEVRLSAMRRWDVMSPLTWVMGVAESAQVHLEQRCYRTLDVPVSPWAPPCQCPPDTHPGQSPQTNTPKPAFGCKMPDWAG